MGKSTKKVASPNPDRIPHDQLLAEVQEFEPSNSIESNLQALIADGVLPLNRSYFVPSSSADSIYLIVLSSVIFSISMDLSW